ncbi:MAG: hypothetical protein A2W52_03250 [Candidatus Taylorbacteria bacterium RIFCSPHIGHO2_02_49_25]|uniref:Tfp pilus assembly protein PilF n=1 Tax=Candidatus Taylorbacteria bacterium RIFCSPHIGHO2_02_49_25 TaxID=1802305 RepID=A0A1G2MFW0_9BACT|nr:MAG: Tetratricopeptide TPR_1 repeat-containing protein [Parcubacteria group bacterium GW2011_GWF2_50_9]OHA20752.1 MAG: hypothetical protein A2759_02040 [Candidatus Taylorbacteria bacterium RIFCSPHIGHO2_01_FULL_49_60]OHA21892.1 MAG: hypothetical protein A2W52_03250 [Candidatus Taylorbacteria bacterium RIFCSPHIGHO2_02_49_25]OHA35370.1 MAG: hypothetical protein A2W65_04755 [Candidatus Taylorbacteria bacterium RIFCSPLOWO2_02_50_13]OHA42030.1 MAG: hypothetical protein A3H73_01760 [Candidatus Tayl
MTNSDVAADYATGGTRGWRGLERISSLCLLALTFIVPIFFVPALSFPSQFSKALLLYIIVLAAFSLWVAARLKDGRFFIPTSPVLAALFAVVGIFALSGLFSGSFYSSFFGQGFEVGTVQNILLLFGLAFFVPAMFRKKEHIFFGYVAFLASFALVALFHLLRLMLGADFLSFGVLTGAASNTLGKWNDLGIFFGVSALLSLVTIEFFSFKRVVKVVAYAALALSLFFLAVVNFSMIWFVLGPFALVFLVYTMSFNRLQPSLHTSGPDQNQTFERTRLVRRIPIPSLIVLIISVVFMLAGAVIGGRIGEEFGISQIEVRPSWSATLDVSRKTLSKDPLLGSGPNHFTSEWLAYKPEGINSTVFWNVDFSYGVGLIPTFLATTGILGALAWLTFFLAFLYAGFKSILSDFPERISQYLVLSSFLVSLFLWVFSIFYVPSLAIFTLTFIFTGLFIASLGILNKAPARTISFGNDPRAGFVSVLVLILLLVGCVALGYDVVRKYYASVLFQKGVIFFNTEGSIDKAEDRISRAASISPTDIYYRFLTDLNLIRMNSVFRRDPATMSAESARVEFQGLLSAAISNARQAVALDTRNYENHLTLGRVYETVVPSRIEGSYEAALAAYNTAQALNPRSPAIHLTKARLEAAKGDIGKARENIALALKEKGNYTEAIFFLSQIEAAEGNIKAAISSVEAASVLAPGDPAIFFQLGILRFNDRNYRAAADALERAVALNPLYANAKYFLGLSYEKLGRDAEAITQFTELKATNPDSKEVDLILRNLKADRDPFSDAAPPVDAAPERRSKLPLEERATALDDKE